MSNMGGKDHSDHHGHDSSNVLSHALRPHVGLVLCLCMAVLTMKQRNEISCVTTGGPGDAGCAREYRRPWGENPAPRQHPQTAHLTGDIKHVLLGNR
jgi:hypothetical protein